MCLESKQLTLKLPICQRRLENIFNWMIMKRLSIKWRFLLKARWSKSDWIYPLLLKNSEKIKRNNTYPMVMYDSDTVISETRQSIWVLDLWPREGFHTAKQINEWDSSTLETVFWQILLREGKDKSQPKKKYFHRRYLIKDCYPEYTKNS